MKEDKLRRDPFGIPEMFLGQVAEMQQVRELRRAVFDRSLKSPENESVIAPFIDQIRKDFRENSSVPNYKVVIFLSGLIKEGKSRWSEGFIDELKAKFTEDFTTYPELAPQVLAHDVSDSIGAAKNVGLVAKGPDHPIGTYTPNEYVGISTIESEIFDFFYSLPGRYLLIAETTLQTQITKAIVDEYGKEITVGVIGTPRTDLDSIKRRIDNGNRIYMVDFRVGEMYRQLYLARWEHAREGLPVEIVRSLRKIGRATPKDLKQVQDYFSQAQIKSSEQEPSDEDANRIGKEIAERLGQIGVITKDPSSLITSYYGQINRRLSEQQLETIASLFSTLIKDHDPRIEKLFYVEADGTKTRVSKLTTEELQRKVKTDFGFVDFLREFWGATTFQYLYPTYDPYSNNATQSRAVVVHSVPTNDEISGEKSYLIDNSLKTALIQYAKRERKPGEIYNMLIPARLKTYGWAEKTV